MNSQGSSGPYSHQQPQAGYPAAYNQGFKTNEPPQYGNPQVHYNNPQPQIQQPQHTNVTIVSQAAAPPPPRDQMGCAIFACLCCFLPTGLAAIIFNSSAKDAYARGDLAVAEQKASTTKTLIIISVVLGCIGYIVIGVLRGVVLSQST